ncbi:MAG: sodium:calcium symporter, partial [Verrucomicrobia bacterium]|nr:sodium:calcium symporter [Verrucomicrobiota bacterium]
IMLALVILVRVLTLGTPNPELPERNLLNGLGSMWNPGSMGEQLRNPQLWLAAAGQIFFSLSVGFGVIITYASYLSNDDDVVLSGLTASSANEFCEVALGGMITVPAAFVFLGSAGVMGQGTFALGFKVLPLVFATLPFPALFGTMFFTLLFLAAVTSSLSMLQPGIAFLEEAMGVGRKVSVAVLGLVTAMGCLFVVHFSKDFKALDTIDFWVGTFLIFVLATILIITFGWGLGIEKGFAEAHRGAHIRIPPVFKFIIKYVSPAYLLIIFALWILFNVLGWNLETGGFAPTGYVADLLGTKDQEPSTVACLSVLLVGVVLTFILVLIATAAPRWRAKLAAAESPVKGE